MTLLTPHWKPFDQGQDWFNEDWFFSPHDPAKYRRFTNLQQLIHN